MASVKRTSKGRQKIEIVRMTNEKQRLVTFSKRRTGLFKKASDLSTLCGADIGIVAFSPTNKAYSFGHPSVGSIIDRYMDGQNDPSQHSNPAFQVIEAHRDDSIQQLNQKLTEALTQLSIEKKHGKELDNRRKIAEDGTNWLKEPYQNLELEQLEELKKMMEHLKIQVTKRGMLMQAANLATKEASPQPSSTRYNESGVVSCTSSSPFLFGYVLGDGGATDSNAAGISKLH